MSYEGAYPQRWLEPVNVDTMDFELVQQVADILHSVGQVSEMMLFVVVSGLREYRHPES